MKKFLIISSVVVLVFVLLLSVAGILFFSLLPSAEVVKSYVNKKIDSQIVAHEIAKKKKSSDHQNENDEDGVGVQTERIAAVLNDLLDEKKPYAEICSYLDNAVNSKFEKFNDEDLRQAVINSVFKTKKDPLIQSFKPFVRQVLRLPHIKKIVQYLLHERLLLGAKVAAKISSTHFEDNVDKTVDIATESLSVSDSDNKSNHEEMSRFQNSKFEFYKEIYFGYREFVQNQEKITQNLDRTYRLMVLIKMVKMKPVLNRDAMVVGYCGRLEKLVNEQASNDFNLERREFNELIEKVGFTPAQLGYNPDYKTQIDFSYTDGHVIPKGELWVTDLVQIPH